MAVLIVASISVFFPRPSDAQVIPVSPIHIVLYSAPGTPGGTNIPYPAPSTAVQCSTGQQITVVAKVFDYNNVWLSEFENSPADTVITWKILEVGGGAPSGTLSNSQGYQTGFFPIRAYDFVYIIVSFTQNGSILAKDTVSIYTRPPPMIYQFVVEADSSWQASPNAPNPVARITLGAVRTSVSVYAMIRDEYGNFVKYSTNTSWASEDTSLVIVEKGKAALGEGIISLAHMSAIGQTRVIATDVDEFPGMAYPVPVTVAGPVDAFRSSNIKSNPTVRMVLSHSSELAFHVPSEASASFAQGNYLFAIYSLLGREVFKARGNDLSHPIVVTRELCGGSYIIVLFANEKMIMKTKTVLVN